MFYDKFQELCKRKGVSCNRAAIEMGLSSATPTKWKRTEATPAGETLERIARYFDISIENLLDIPKATPEFSAADQDELLMYALFDGEATPEQLEEVKRFAAYVKARDEK